MDRKIILKTTAYGEVYSPEDRKNDVVNLSKSTTEEFADTYKSRWNDFAKCPSVTNYSRFATTDGLSKEIGLEVSLNPAIKTPNEQQQISEGEQPQR